MMQSSYIEERGEREGERERERERDREGELEESGKTYPCPSRPRGKLLILKLPIKLGQTNQRF